MTAVMQGVRVLEVAEHTFVPAASALLADWGAEVIKIEHVERGDAMRGLASSGTVNLGGDVHVLLEHSNRGKQSLGLDLTSEDGLEILGKLAATCDVFLTNKMPSVRTKLNVDVEDIRAHNPDIIYVRGTGQGERGPDADKGSYDSLAFWNRAGVAMGQKQADEDHVPPPPAPAFGDSIGAMTIAGGIMGALFHRERTGEATTVDVSLLGTGLWSMGAAIGPVPAARRALGAHRRRAAAPAATRWSATTAPRTTATWPSAASSRASTGPRPSRLIGLPELADDERFADAATILANGDEGYELLAAAFAERTLEEWRERLADFSGQWAIVQNTIEAAADPQSVANGYVQRLRDRRRGPVPAGHGPGPVRRAARPGRAGRRSSTSTATPSSRASASTGTRSWTSRSAASWPEAGPTSVSPWGDAAHLVDILDVRSEGDGRFIRRGPCRASAARRRGQPDARPGPRRRRAAGRPGRRVVSAVDGLPPGRRRRSAVDLRPRPAQRRPHVHDHDGVRAPGRPGARHRDASCSARRHPT